MASRKIERGIDDALLATATWAGYLYLRRRARRIFSQAVTGAAVTAAAGAVATVGAAVTWKRSRSPKATPPNA
jgi:threonine/homoserine efflux transporter RhtA